MIRKSIMLLSALLFAASCQGVTIKVRSINPDHNDYVIERSMMVMMESTAEYQKKYMEYTAAWVRYDFSQNINELILDIPVNDFVEFFASQQSLGKFRVTPDMEGCSIVLDGNRYEIIRH